MVHGRWAIDDGSAVFDSVECVANGELRKDSSASWPTCRPYIRCPFAPASSPDSNWILNSAMPAVENSKGPCASLCDVNDIFEESWKN